MLLNDQQQQQQQKESILQHLQLIHQKQPEHLGQEREQQQHQQHQQHQQQQQLQQQRLTNCRSSAITTTSASITITSPTTKQLIIFKGVASGHHLTLASTL